MSAETMFEKEVGVGNGKMLVTQDADSEGGERIRAKVWKTWDFGDWRDPSGCTSPTVAEVEEAVGNAMGTKVAKVSIAIDDGEITVNFVRQVEQAAEPAPAGPVAAEPTLPFPKQVPEADELAELDELHRWRGKQEKLAGEADEAWAEWQDAEQDAEMAKKKSKAAEATYSEIMTRLRKSILAQHEDHPLFPAQTNGTAKAGGPAPVTPADDAWRATPLSDLGLSKALEAKLTDGWCKPDDKPVMLGTVGQLSDWIDAMGKRNFIDPIAQIKGVGAKAAETIVEALDAFWERRAAPAEPALERQPETPAEEPHEPEPEPKKKRGKGKKLKGGLNTGKAVIGKGKK